jgi:protein phosphatase
MRSVELPGPSSWGKWEYVQVHVAAATHTGRVRAVNEDAYLTLPELILVADGMGGHAAGDVASSLTVEAFEPLRHRTQLHAADVLEALQRANRAILDESDEHPEKSGMGTTVTGLAIVDEAGSPHWLVFNIGDSRVYRIADGGLHQLTVDHSEVAGLIAQGQISRNDARTHPLRHVITRSLGVLPAPEPDTWLVPVTSGDVFLVCSDGLTSELADTDIARITGRIGDLDETAAQLVQAAVEAGGRDNITVVLVASEAAVTDSALDTGSTVPRKKLRHRGTEVSS